MGLKTAAMIAVAVTLFFVFVPPIAQDESYHAFADSRVILGIPNFWNVVSNIPFALVGIIGLRKLRGATARILFAGVLLTFFGSAYYHLAPSDARLVWDRMPMTMVFMCFLYWILAGETNARSESPLLHLMLAVGIASVVWWQVTGDLRPYVLVQFGPIVVLLAKIHGARHSKFLWAVLACYALAKLSEHFDACLYSFLPLSGHTCKHLFAAASTYCILRYGVKSSADAPGDTLGACYPVQVASR
jgi:hypothetical protein